MKDVIGRGLLECLCPHKRKNNNHGHVFKLLTLIGLLSSLRSKRFQSSYCAKVKAKAKKRFVPLPLPRHSFYFFCCCPSFLDERREGTLAMQASYYQPWLDTRAFFVKGNCPTIGHAYR